MDVLVELLHGRNAPPLHPFHSSIYPMADNIFPWISLHLFEVRDIINLRADKIN